MEIEVEQAPRGKVNVEVRRDGRTLIVPMPAGEWDISARPILEEKTLESYLAARAAAESGDFSGSTTALVNLSKAANASADDELSVWFLSRAARSAADGHDPERAQKLYRAAIEAAARRGRWRIESSLWIRLALAQDDQNDFVAEEHSLQTARAIRTRHESGSLIAAGVLHDMAAVEQRSGHLERAGERYAEALNARERLAPGSLPVAGTLHNLGGLRLSAGDLDGAEQLYSRARAIAEAKGPNSLVLLACLGDLAMVAVERGNLQAAERLSTRVLRVLEQRDPRSLDTAMALGQLGFVVAKRGDLARADAYVGRSLAIFREKAPRSPQEGESLWTLGLSAAARGDTAAAEAYSRAALVVFREAVPDNVDLISTSLIQLGSALVEADNPRAGEAMLRESVEMRRQASPDSVNLATAMSALGVALARRGEIDESEILQRQSLEILQRQAPGSLQSAAVLYEMGQLSLARDNLSEARAYFGRALDIERHVGSDDATMASTLHALGWLDHREGDNQNALRKLVEAVSILERQGVRLGGGPEARGTFNTKHRALYYDCITSLLEQQQPGAAFAMSERFRAQSLLQLLAERDLVIDISPELHSERRRADAEYDRTQQELASLGTGSDPGAVDALRARLNDLRTKRQEAAARIKEASAKFASLENPQALDLAATRAMLGPTTLLLSYAIGKERSYLFAVEPANAAGPALTIYSLSGDEKSLRDEIEAYRNLLDSRGPVGGNSSQALLERSRSLYRTLVEPAEALISRYDHILILPDGPAHKLPFAALVRDLSGVKPQYLVEWKPLHSAVSATVYAELKKSRSDAPRNPSVIVAAFGDPHYPKLPESRIAAMRGDGEPEGLQASVELVDGLADPQLRSVARGGFHFEPLPASRKEVEQIASLYAPKAVAYLGSDATEERAKSIGRDVPLIHFACHAVINERFPLDSALVFSIPEHPAEGQDNGLLQAWEIFEKVRIDADLVTLSACDSGLGKEMGGEGLIGLTRAFQYAGARSVLASLWKVEDTSTAELMKRFYQYLKSGKTKDEALRSAQIDLIRSSTYSHPRDWAAFQLNGDWK